MWNFKTEWKAYNDPSGPRADGLSVGKYADGADVYIGRASYSGYLTPGSLRIAQVPIEWSGLSIEYGGAERVIRSNVEYYAKDSDCNYKWVSSSYGARVDKAVSYRAQGYDFYVGRVYYGNRWFAGKISFGHQCMYFGSGGAAYNVKTYEVLTCEKIVTTTQRATTTTERTTTKRTTTKKPEVVDIEVINNKLEQELSNTQELLDRLMLENLKLKS